MEIASPVQGYDAHPQKKVGLPQAQNARSLEVNWLHAIVLGERDQSIIQRNPSAPMTMASKTVLALASLANESRLAIYRALVEAGQDGLAAGAISEAMDIPPSSVSFHMKELARADMVISRSEGRFVIYTANFETINALVEFLTENCCGGKDCLPAMSCKPAKKPAARRKTA